MKVIAGKECFELPLSGLIYNSYFIIVHSLRSVQLLSLLFKSASLFSVLSDLLYVFVSISVCHCVMFRPLSSVASHAWHHIHFLDASKGRRSDAVERDRRAQRSRAKWSRAPTASNWPLHHYYSHAFFSVPQMTGLRARRHGSVE